MPFGKTHDQYTEKPGRSRVLRIGEKKRLSKNPKFLSGVQDLVDFGIAQFCQGFFLDLANPFFRKSHHFADFFQIQVGIHIQAIIKPDDTVFLIRQIFFQAI